MGARVSDVSTNTMTSVMLHTHCQSVVKVSASALAGLGFKCCLSHTSDFNPLKALAFVFSANRRERQTETEVCLFVGCLTSQQHASVSQGRICSDNFT